MAQTGQRVDPYGNFNFLVEIDGITRAAFHEVSGFDSTIDVVEHREGGENTTVRKLPGMTKHSNIVLKWGLADDADLYNWHRDAVTLLSQGTVDHVEKLPIGVAGQRPR